ncbi:hypothetical protein RKD48_004668 [Streptomyces ambofaciens]
MTSATPTRSSRRARGAFDSVMKRWPRTRPRDADRQVDEEDGPPFEPEEVPLGEQGAQQRAGDGTESDDRAEQPEDLAAFVRREGGVHDRQDLRHHQRRHAALEDAGGDQHLRVGGEAAQRRGHGEAADADEEDPLAAVDVAEPSAGDQAGREGERVTGGDPLDLAEGGALVLLDGGDGDVDDGDVHQVHERRGHHDREGEPATSVARGGGGRDGRNGSRVRGLLEGHGRNLGGQ